jgi:hypothetical protein
MMVFDRIWCRVIVVSLYDDPIGAMTGLHTAQSRLQAFYRYTHALSRPTGVKFVLDAPTHSQIHIFAYVDAKTHHAITSLVMTLSLLLSRLGAILAMTVYECY